jgi:hypothetical protein
MSQSVAEQKAALMKELEAAVDKLLAQAPAPDKISLTEIEEAALGLGQIVQETVTRHWVARSIEVGERQRPDCPKCQQAMRHKGYRERQVVTQSGEIRVRRAYYYCESCKEGIFPPG